jgi:hypothetical protein
MGMMFFSPGHFNFKAKKTKIDYLPLFEVFERYIHCILNLGKRENNE